MAPHGAPSPGRRRPPISPASLPAGPARLRRGALRGDAEDEVPPGGSFGPYRLQSGGPQENGDPQFSRWPAGQETAGLRQDPSLEKGVSA